MITEDYVSFETAKLLKEKGFVVPYDSIRGVYINGEFLRLNPGQGYLHNMNDELIDVCSIQMVIKWLRRKKGFHILVPMEIDYDEDEGGGKWYRDAAFYPEIIRVSDGKIMYDDDCSLYAEPEQAYEVAIKYCLENLI